jgi:hypothetical protein
MCTKVRQYFKVRGENIQQVSRFKDFLSAAILALVALIISLGTFRETPRGLFANKIPLAGDGLLTGLYIKVVDQSSYLSIFLQNISSTQFGWPNRLDFTSYPVGNTQEMLAIKIFMDATSINDPSQIIHIFSILKASPIAIAAFILARSLGINRILSFGLGLVFSLNTFNLVRAEGHFFLGLTWSLPLGLAAIYTAFKQVNRSEPISRNKILAVTFLGAFSFLSGYYYSVFLIIFGFISLLFLAIYVNHHSSAKPIRERALNSIRILVLPIYVFAIFVLGLLLQTLPILFRQGSISSVTGLADRSSVEAIIYAGTPESLLFDFYSFGLRLLNRPDLVAYLQSRISWEASQVGALSGAILISILILALILGLLKLVNINVQPFKKRFQLDCSATFVILLLSITLLFYFVSPLNYSVSRILPQIRAWGRLSVVISLLTLLLLGLFLSRLRKSDLVIWPLLIVFIFIPLFEVKQFSTNRPPSIALSNSADEQFQDFQLALNELRAIYPKDCSLVNLPLYPFPEFDRPDDNNIDYGQLQLPIIDEGYFKWSYAGVKATENFATWQPLISEFPPFARAQIEDQINYAESLGACGVLIDRTFLTVVENLDLRVINGRQPSCISELLGPTTDTFSRYISINFFETKCKSIPVPGSKSIVDYFPPKGLVWRIDQSSEQIYKGLFQVFPASSSISLRLQADLNPIKEPHFLKIRIFSDEQLVKSQVTVLFTNLRNGEIQSFAVAPNSEGNASIQLPSSFVTGKIEKISVTLTNFDESNVSSWGIQVGTKD